MNTAKGMPVKTGRMDLAMAAAVVICLLAAKFIPEFQIMTACIAVLLCVQDGPRASLKASLIRLLITTVGGLAGVLVTLLDNAISNTSGIAAVRPWLFIALVALGLLLTLTGCKLAGAPAFNARIGGVTFILVALSKTGSDRIWYALFRLLSTIYGVIVVMITAALFSLTGRKTPGPDGEKNLHQ